MGDAPTRLDAATGRSCLGSFGFYTLPGKNRPTATSAIICFWQCERPPKVDSCFGNTDREEFNMSVLGFVGVALSAVLLVVALVTSSVPIAYTALAGIAFILIDAFRALKHPHDPFD
jgi:hypothetical protein